MRLLTRQPSRWAVRIGLVGFVVGSLMLSMVPSAPADDLDDARDRVEQEIGQLDSQRDDLQTQLDTQREEVAEADANNLAATNALKEAESQLADAEAKLAAAESQVRESEEIYEQRQAELKEAEIALEKAKADVDAARAAYDSLNTRIDREVSMVTQQQGPLVNIALFLTNTDASELNHRAQLGTTLFDLSALQLDEAEQRRFALDEAQAKADAAEQKAQEARKAAEEELAKSKAASEEAASLKDEVARLVAERDSAAQAASAALEREEAIQASMEQEAADVEERIKARLEKASQLDDQIAERDAEAERKRKEEEAADNAAKEESSSSSSSSSGSSDFIYPVSGRITSPYGMRVHPVTGVYKLHDGTDFAASCGTAIKAAGDGVVVERYYNSGYGNRLMIDHGKIDGINVTTGYNHATRYIVSVGESVKQGQTIGYVGSTGYSTGCHLHLMVWENGDVVNPMKRWF